MIHFKNRLFGYPLMALILLGFLFLSAQWSDHALYIGVIQIEHQEDTALSTMDIKVFSDDLQNALKNEFDWKQLPKVSVACDAHTNAIEQYFQNHLTISINKEPISITLQDCTNNTEVYILSYTLSTPKKWETLTLKADFLMELFPTQTNVLQVQYQSAKSKTMQPFFGKMVKRQYQLEFEIGAMTQGK